MNRAVYIPVLSIYSMLLLGCSDATERSVVQPRSLIPNPEMVQVQTQGRPLGQAPIEAEAAEDDESSLEQPLEYEVLSRTDIVIGEAHWTKVELKADVTVVKSADRLHSTGGLLIFAPTDSTRTVIGLPGWNFASRTWEDNAKISELAKEYNFTVVLPEMGKSVYESEFYPETKKANRWAGPDEIPGARWVGEVVYKYIEDNHPPFSGIFGLSTGGRGAILVPQLYYKVWQLKPIRACSMSGTFDLLSLKPTTGEYRIHSAVYGERKQHLERWKVDDSMLRVEALKGVEILLIHGSKDPYVPVSQSAGFHAAMNKLTPDKRSPKYIFDRVVGGGHDWRLWSHYVRDCFSFMSIGTQVVPPLKPLPPPPPPPTGAVTGADAGAVGDSASGVPTPPADTPAEAPIAPPADTPAEAPIAPPADTPAEAPPAEPVGGSGEASTEKPSPQ
jgi:hypothetical protein